MLSSMKLFSDMAVDQPGNPEDSFIVIEDNESALQSIDFVGDKSSWPGSDSTGAGPVLYAVGSHRCSTTQDVVAQSIRACEARMQLCSQHGNLHVVPDLHTIIWDKVSFRKCFFSFLNRVP